MKYIIQKVEDYKNIVDVFSEASNHSKIKSHQEVLGVISSKKNKIQMHSRSLDRERVRV